MLPLGGPQCRTYLKLSLEQLPEVFGQFYVMEVQDDPNLTPEQKRKALEAYRKHVNGAEEVIAFVRAFLKGYGELAHDGFRRRNHGLCI